MESLTFSSLVLSVSLTTTPGIPIYHPTLYTPTHSESTRLQRTCVCFPVAPRRNNSGKSGVEHF